MKITIAGGLLVAALAIASVADAQSRTPVINRTHHRQERRITRDVRHGRITRMQAYHLRREERRMERERRMALAGHRMDRGERRHLRREEGGINRQLHHDVHADKVS